MLNRKLNYVFFVLAFGVGLSAHSSAVAEQGKAEAPAFRPDLPTNTWVRVEPKYLPQAGGGRHRPQSWNKLIFDSVGRRVIYLDRWSDDVRRHSIYANAVLAFDPKINEVACLKINNWWQRTRTAEGYSTMPMPENETDPTPCDRHPYGNVTFVPDQNAVYLSTGANQGAFDGKKKGHAVTSDTWRFDLESRKWTKVVSEKEPPRVLEESMCYDPVNRAIVRIASRGAATWLLDVKTGQWRNANAKNNPHCGAAAAMCYDSKRGRILLFGGRGKNNSDKRWNAPGVELWSYTVTDNEWKRLPDSPIPGRAAGMDYDPVNDCVVLHFSLEKLRPGRTLFYLCDKNEWRALPKEADALGPAAPWHGLAYDSANRVFVRAARDNDTKMCGWWLFRPDLSKTERVKPSVPPQRASQTVIETGSVPTATESSSVTASAPEELPQGVRGRVMRLVGAYMDIEEDLGKPELKPLSVPVHVFRGRLQPFDKPDPKHPALVKTVKSDKEGRYSVPLPPGEYTVVVEIDGELYLNNYIEDGSWAPVAIRAGQWRDYTIEDVNPRSKP